VPLNIHIAVGQISLHFSVFGFVMMYESISCPQCENMNLNIQSLKMLKNAVEAGKRKNVTCLTDFSKDQWPVSDKTRDS